jgi:hypothetical protein
MPQIGVGLPAKIVRDVGMVPEVGLEPTWALSPPDFESGAYTNFATPAQIKMIRRRQVEVKIPKPEPRKT